MHRLPSWSVLVLCLAATGCYQRHGRSGASPAEPRAGFDQGAADDGTAVGMPQCPNPPLSAPVTIVDDEVDFASLDHGNHDVAALPTGFVVVWPEVRDGGVGVAAAILDVDGRVVREPFDASPGREQVTSTVAVAAHGDRIEVYWREEGGGILWRNTIVDDVVGEPMLLGEPVARFPLHARADASSTTVITGERPPLALTVAPDGSVVERTVLRMNDGQLLPWGGARREETWLIGWWLGAPVRTLYARFRGGPELELESAELIYLSVFGRTAIVQQEVGFLAAARRDSSVLYRFEEEVAALELGTAFPGYPILVADESGGLIVLSSGGPRGLANFYTALALRDVSFSGELGRPLIVAETSPPTCRINRYAGARGATHELFTWADDCVSRRRLMARTRLRCPE